MNTYYDLNYKIFLVDYRFYNDRKVYTHMTYAASRKCAENSVRNIESPNRINIVKITSFIQDQEFHDRVDEALATFKESNEENYSTEY